MPITRLADGLWRIEDSCVVYLIEAPEGLVAINVGTGAWLDDPALPARPAALLCTHHFRDHSAGATRAAEYGIEVWAPWYEREYFLDGPGHLARRETWIVYDNLWDRFCPVEPIPVTGWLRDWDRVTIAGLEFTVLPTPGASSGAVSLETNHAHERLIFCGELIHSPGRIARIAPLQYNYNDLPGAVNLLYAIGVVEQRKATRLLPSLAPAVIETPPSALAALRDNLQRALAPRPEYAEPIRHATTDELAEVTPHLYQSTCSNASTWFLVSESGTVCAIDYGYRFEVGNGSFLRNDSSNRRPVLHGLDALRRRFGIERVDVVVVTHFHDDHVNGIPMLQRLFGTRCVACDTFAWILRDPERSQFPCTWPEPIDVESVPVDGVFEWQEYTFRFAAMSGHTEFSAMVGFEVDGERIVATGDQYIPRAPAESRMGGMIHNHVYRNGARLESIRASNRALRAFDPTIILPGHGAAFRVNADFWHAIERYASEYEESHCALLPIGAGEPHFDVDSRAAWIDPYRRIGMPGEEVRYLVHVRNPSPAPARIAVELAGRALAEPVRATTEANARGEVAVAITVRLAPDAGQRLPITATLFVDGRNLGAVTEALVSIGRDAF